MIADASNYEGIDELEGAGFEAPCALWDAGSGSAQFGGQSGVQG